MQPTQRVLVLLALGLAACAAQPRDDDGKPRTAATDNAKKSDASTPLDAGAPTARADSGRGSAATCPVARPAEGNVCSTSSELCAYDEIECRCPSGVWSCEEPVHPDCPASAPAHDSSCTLPEATECDFLQQECECLSGKWACQSEEEEGDAGPSTDGGAQTARDGAVQTGRDGGPDAGGNCPEARPAELGTCAANSRTCTYESTQCVCPDGVWSCSEPVDVGCPATTPLHGEACSGIADCDFLEVECECLRGAWSCKAND
jgi:hypothetical protein